MMVNVITKNDSRWDEWYGGYGSVTDMYDVLLQLENGTADYIKVWEFVWDELHHQGDVGAASYAFFSWVYRFEESNPEYWSNVLAYCDILMMPSKLNQIIPIDVYENYYIQSTELIVSACQRLEMSDDERFLLFSLISSRQKSKSMRNFMHYFMGTDVADYLNNL